MRKVLLKNGSKKQYIFRDENRTRAFNKLGRRIPPSDILNAAIREFAKPSPYHRRHPYAITYHEYLISEDKKLGDKVNFKISQTSDVIDEIHIWQKDVDSFTKILDKGLDLLIAKCTTHKGEIEVERGFNIF